MVEIFPNGPWRYDPRRSARHGRRVNSVQPPRLSIPALSDKDPAYLGQLVPMMLDEYLAALTVSPPGLR